MIPVAASPSVAFVAFMQRWIRAAEEEGRRYAPALLAFPAGSWRSEMGRDPHLRSYGTLKIVLEQIHRDHFQSPRLALERSAIVIDYVDRVDVPERVTRTAIRGLARKEYANALRMAGSLKEAVLEAQRSQAIYAEVGALTHDAAKAQLVEAGAWNELQQFDKALTLARQCREVFRDHGDSEYFTFARMTEAWVLFESRQPGEALDIFTATAADAEGSGDKHTLATCLHNAAACARALGRHDVARLLDKRSLAHFEELGARVELPRIRWTHALSLADLGNVPAAISELFKTRAEFLHLGMNGDASVCSLDVVRLRFDAGEDVTETCAELVRTFVAAGMTQNAIEALAYLREQASSGRLSSTKIRKVREYLSELSENASMLFIRPPDEEEEW